MLRPGLKSAAFCTVLAGIAAASTWMLSGSSPVQAAGRGGGIPAGGGPELSQAASPAGARGSGDVPTTGPAATNPATNPAGRGRGRGRGPVAPPKTPEEALKNLVAPQGLEITQWATEPQLVKPVAMDIDERGRIWITEGANYRSSRTRPEGDRILILEDTQKTGKADSVKVFAQDPSLVTPLGITVMGNKVYVAMSPNILVYTIDESGDRPVGPPQTLFTGFGGVNHDHGLHTVVYGPEGRLYFNAGNEGGRGSVFKYGDLIAGRAGQNILDISQSEIGARGTIFRGQPRQGNQGGYVQGLVMRSNMDGSEVQVLGQNFRNEFETSVDSFGSVFVSDNDDDGNQGVRLAYVMEGGNFGYTGIGTGSNWTRDMNQNAELFPGQTRQEAHWHQRYPGVVPNLLHTGSGSPTGMLVYEGNLLPEMYRGALFHADAGPNVYRAFPLKPSALRTTDIARSVPPDDAANWLKADSKGGAGYETRAVDLITSQADTWFRPVTGRVAPDGSVYLTDWSDAVVGGHATRDTGASEADGWTKMHGRIYRIAPPGHKPSVPTLVLNTIPGQIAALNSPNNATRYLGHTALTNGLASASSADVIRALQQQFDTDKNPRLRARALWLLASAKSAGTDSINKALKDSNPDIRITALRAARWVKMDMVGLANQMLNDASPAVLRELCLAMQFEPTEKALPVLVKLAGKYDGHDRWYLEAFGIGAFGREAEVLEAYQKDHPADDAQSKGIVWRLKLQPSQPPEAAAVQ